ncbi:hypothetical protein TRFO_09242 [Tritrichomonas foetus]|uniref:Uncharacterized protein n=1 Tax=Tritrichomonas foetus TaxID=1144522 RepID=A0A1J4JGL8_9EUKA|nr:hypothetical protein TRFO_09242 [Tritrichomonas foetus]|eukprot:OHS97817.1 hypothetical protein TRFO_09242 [Tritrichomonas foetus]
MKNIKGVINIALRPENSPLSLRACGFFSTDNRSLINGLLQTELIQTIANQIFSDIENPPNLLMMARFSSILVSCFALFPEKTAEWCNFLDKFLPYCSLHPVLNLFASIVTIKEDDGKLIQFLFQSGIIPLAISKIRDLPDKIEKDGDVVFSIGMFRLMRVLALREEVCQVLRQPENIQVLIKNYQVERVDLLFSQWSLYLILCNQSSLPFMTNLIATAILNLRSQTPVFYRYQALCLEFLAQALSLSSRLADNFVEFNIGELTKTIFLRFPNHSNAHFKVFNLIQQCLNHPQLCSQVLSEIIPFASHQIIERSNVILSIFCWHMLHQIECVNEEAHNAIQNIPDETKEQMRRIDEATTRDFGGEVPKMENQDIAGGAPELSPDELLSLFREFTMRR